MCQSYPKVSNLGPAGGFSLMSSYVSAQAKTTTVFEMTAGTPCQRGPSAACCKPQAAVVVREQVGKGPGKKANCGCALGITSAPQDFDMTSW